MRTVLPDASYFSSQVSQTRRFYHLSPELHAGSHVAVVAGGCEWCAADFLIERSKFPYLAIEFVWAGRGKIRLGRHWHDLAPGAVYLFDSTVPHLIRSDPDHPLVKYFFNFTGHRARRLCGELELRAGSIFRTTEPAHVMALLNEAIDRALQGSERGVRESAATLEHALAICSGSRRPWNPVPEAAHATYLRCRNFLLRHFPSLPNVAHAALACSITPAYLTRLFRRYERATPSRFLQQLKMNEAMLRLKEPGVQAKAVAASLGFKSAAHFSRAFRSFHGVLPRDAMEVA